MHWDDQETYRQCVATGSVFSSSNTVIDQKRLVQSQGYNRQLSKRTNEWKVEEEEEEKYVAMRNEWIERNRKYFMYIQNKKIEQE